MNADLILTDAHVYAVDAARSNHEAVAVAGGRILAAGSAADVAATRGRATATVALPSPALELARGAELGRFNLGSTVILVLPPRACAWRSDAGPGNLVRLGQALGRRP